MDRLKAYLDSLKFDFVGRRYLAGGLSLVLVLGSWLAFFGVGPKWGIDFTGGTEIVLRFEQAVEIGEVRGALQTLGLSEDSVQRIGASDEYEFAIRIQDAGFGLGGLQAEIEGAVQRDLGEGWLKDIAVDAEVGARFLLEAAAPKEGDLERLQQALQSQTNLTVQEGREEGQYIVSAAGLTGLIQEQIKGAMGERGFEVLTVDAVGPKVGGELRRQGALAILATLGLVLVYVAFRFDLSFAPGAVLALFHDVSVTVGIFILAGLEFNLPMVGALLTIVGYSLNDTIVIYDRIRENQGRYRRRDLKELINHSINETLTRTLSTSGTTMLAIIMLLFMGGVVLRDFAIAMMCGIVFGTYSTIFVASPMILVMEELKPYLSRLIVTAPGGAAPGADVVTAGAGAGAPSGPAAPEGPLTESERRRRERAEAERRQRES